MNFNIRKLFSQTQANARRIITNANWNNTDCALPKIFPVVYFALFQGIGTTKHDRRNWSWKNFSKRTRRFWYSAADFSARRWLSVWFFSTVSTKFFKKLHARNFEQRRHWQWRNSSATVFWRWAREFFPVHWQSVWHSSMQWINSFENRKFIGEDISAAAQSSVGYSKISSRWLCKSSATVSRRSAPIRISDRFLRPQPLPIYSEGAIYFAKRNRALTKSLPKKNSPPSFRRGVFRLCSDFTLWVSLQHKMPRRRQRM